MYLLLYKLFLLVYQLGIRIASILNLKARSWIAGRNGILKKIEGILGIESEKSIWMHCASLGEFEQGRPVLEKLVAEYPGFKIIITFFSPSGYEIRKNYNLADHVFYLPMDGRRNASQFIKLINPAIVLWIKYEFWHYYLLELKKKKVPTLLISASFRENQRFFSWHGSFWSSMLQNFTLIFLQNQYSAKLLEQIGFRDNVIITGDTRFDRVIQIAENFVKIPGMDVFCNNHPVIVAGSTWEEDEAIFMHYAKAHQGFKFIIAPHEVDKENILDIKREFGSAIFYSELLKMEETNPDHSTLPNVLIIDCIGILSRLYKYADIAYIGGGFGDDGIHNILEAAVYGKPVLFGPETEKNYEALEMIESGGAIIVHNALELEVVINEMINNPIELKLKGDASRDFILKNAGASSTIIRNIQEKRLLTN